MEENSPLFEQYPLVDAVDHEILMHRDAHFGGLFSIMLDYYRQEGKGVQPDFDLERIEELDKLEQGLNQNLAVLYLTGSEIEKIGEAKEAYKKLRAIYEVTKTKNSVPRLLADLILAEEEEAESEVQAIVDEKDLMVPALIDLLRNENFYDSLFPGYGLAPALAVKCLGRIGDKRALISLFEALGHGDFFDDEQIVRALKAIGEPAKKFLLKVVEGHPINEDNEKAAIALIGFKEDPEVALACFKLLSDPEVRKDPCLPIYLILACEGLQYTPEKAQFIALSSDPTLPKQLKEDMKVIIHEWEES